MACIYKATIENTDEGFPKSYIGQTSGEFEKRYKQHKNHYKNGDTVFYRACLKYGWDNVNWKILQYCNSQKELDEYEIYYIDKFRTYIKFDDCQGYNMTLGGQGGSKFTKWDANQLRDIRKDIKNCISKEEIQQKYRIKGRTYFEIARGEKWSLFTKIPFDERYEKNTCLTKYQVDKILILFKELHETNPIMEQLKLKRRVILDVLMGKSWSKYTDIKDMSFYNQYVQKSKYSDEQIQYILNSEKNALKISEELNIPHSTVLKIRSGKMLGEATQIKYIPKEEKEMPANATFSRETAEQILKEYFEDGKTKMELSRKYNLQYQKISQLVDGQTCKYQFNVSKLTQEEKIKRGYKTNQINLEEVSKVIELQKEGKTISDIYKFFDGKFSKNIIESILSGRTWSWYTGIEYNQKKKTGEFGTVLDTKKVDKIIDLYFNQNKNCKEIRDILNLDRRLVWSIVVRKRWSSYTGIKYESKRKKKE